MRVTQVARPMAAWLPLALAARRRGWSRVSSAPTRRSVGGLNERTRAKLAAGALVDPRHPPASLIRLPVENYIRHPQGQKELTPAGQQATARRWRTRRPPTPSRCRCVLLLSQWRRGNMSIAGAGQVPWALWSWGPPGPPVRFGPGAHVFPLGPCPNSLLAPVRACPQHEEVAGDSGDIAPEGGAEGVSGDLGMEDQGADYGGEEGEAGPADDGMTVSAGHWALLARSLTHAGRMQHAQH